MDEIRRCEAVQQAMAGDADAVQRLIVEYHAALHRRIEQGIAPELRHRIDPEEVLQQAYISVFQSVAECRFDNPAAFYGWLETVALARLKDAERKWRRAKRDAGREVQVPVGETRTSLPGFVAQLTASDTSPSRRVARDETAAAVLSSLARLSEDQRAVIQLRFLAGLEVPEVAARLEKTEAAIHMLCHRGLKALRELMSRCSEATAHGV